MYRLFVLSLNSTSINFVRLIAEILLFSDCDAANTVWSVTEEDGSLHREV